MQRSTADAGAGQGYGIGWLTSEYAGGRRSVSRTGGMGGVSTALRLFPAEKIVIVVLTNAGSHPVAGQVMVDIVKAVLPPVEAGRADSGLRGDPAHPASPGATGVVPEMRPSRASPLPFGANDDGASGGDY